MSKYYDSIAIGGGSDGLSVAERAARYVNTAPLLNPANWAAPVIKGDEVINNDQLQHVVK